MTNWTTQFCFLPASVYNISALKFQSSHSCISTLKMFAISSLTGRKQRCSRSASFPTPESSSMKSQWNLSPPSPIFDILVSGASIGITCRSHPEIIVRLGMARASTKDLDHMWRSRLVLSMKVLMYNICIVPIALYASETKMLVDADNNEVNSFEQCWCLWCIYGVQWSDHITNDKICRCSL